ncbi:hypothetical protein ACFL4G_02520 [Thermodesulfobacteriota bacterium]
MDSFRKDAVIAVAAPLLAMALVVAMAGCSNEEDGGLAPLCIEGETGCSDDALVLNVCRNGAWEEETYCMRDHGRLCEDGACVDPWRYGSPAFDACDDDPYATSMSLAEKAVKYDRLAEVLHVHPNHKRIAHVTVAEGYDESNATYENVVQWHTGENDGLWTGLYITSQAFRYAVTRDREALDVLLLMMEGMELGMRITGVSGLFTREYKTPGIEGMSCPSNPNHYIPSDDKKDNRWVKVDPDGTIVIYDGEGEAWVRTDHRVPEEFGGYCWLDNISQDEYAGHMLALASIYALVDDPVVRGKAAALAEEVSEHLMINGLNFVDWDCRITEHGKLWFNPAFTLGFFKPGVVASGREDLLDFYDNCLLAKGEPMYDCMFWRKILSFSYADLLEPVARTALYVGHDGCKSNWNNFAMVFCAIFSLLLHEHDPDVRALVAESLENQLFYHDDNVREMAGQHNAGWTMMYTSMKNLGPGSTGQDIAAIEDAICALQQFPESKASPELHVGEDEFPTDCNCESRFEGRYLTFDPVPVYLRCPATFTWWSNPYSHQHCDENPRYIKHPADYLMPYWMGRYFGYIDETW